MTDQAATSSRRLTPRADGPTSRLTRFVGTLLVLAVFFTLYVAAGFFMPVLIAVLLALIFQPVVAALQRIRVPSVVSAGLIMILLFGLGLYAVRALAGPVREWVADAPTTMARVSEKIRTLRKPIEEAGKAAEQVQKLADPPGTRVTPVEVKGEGFGVRMLSGTVNVVTSVVIVGFLMFFLLSTGGRLLRKIADYVAHRTARESSAELVAVIEKQVARCLALTTLINLSLGVAVGAALWLIGLPHPVLWGVVVTVLNYVPYIGGVIGTALVGIAGFLAFEDPMRMVAAPLAYIVLNTIEGMLVTPLVLGRRFALDSCFVFIWLMYWSWTWGAVGAVVAMPLLTAIKITCERTASMQALGRLISADEPDETRGLVARMRRRRPDARPATAAAGR